MLHEYGYRYCWPPTIGNLTPRQANKLRLAKRAEAYIQQERQGSAGDAGDPHTMTQRPGHDRSVSDDFYQDGEPTITPPS